MIQAHPIFQPFRLNGHQLVNRAVVAPMSRVKATPAGLATGYMADYYSAYAKGGFSMIITEGIYTDELGSKAYANQPGLTSEEHIAAWQKTVHAVSANNSVIIAQLMHAGALSQLLTKTLAPSLVQPRGSKMESFGGHGSFALPDRMSEADINAARNGFIKAARAAYLAGFSGVEIHAANGYLLDQFLTPHLNLRTDDYGGPMRNRFRIIAEIIRGIRLEVPDTFVIGLRLSEGKVNDLAYRWPDGRLTALELLEQVKNAEPDFVHIAVQSGEWERDSFYPDGSSFAALARRITGKPVMANGGLHDLIQSRRVLEEGHADLIAIGKAALTDPAWPEKTRDGILHLSKS